MGYMSHRFKTAKIVCYVMLGDTTFFLIFVVLVLWFKQGRPYTLF